MIPRIRARVGTVEEPPEHKGKFCFEVFLAFMGEGEGRKLGDWGPFDTEKQAHVEMKEVVKVISDTIEEKMTGKLSGNYLDMKTNEMRPWNPH